MSTEIAVVNNTTTPTNRLALIFGGKPLAAVEPPKEFTPPALDEALQHMAVQLTPILPMWYQDREETYDTGEFWVPQRQRWVRHELPKGQLFEAFPRALKTLRDMEKSSIDFLVAIARCNISLRNIREDGWVNDLASALVQEAGGLAREPLPEIQRAELALQPVQEIHTRMLAALRHGTTHVVANLFAALERMKSAEQIGGIDWLAPDVCRYSFYQWKITDDTLNVTHSERQQTSTFIDRRVTTTEHTKKSEMLRTLSHGIHVHEAINATRSPLGVSGTIPLRVRTFIEAIPAWIKPHVQLVAGDEIFQRIVERDLKSERRTDTEVNTTENVEPIERREQVYKHDPAVVLGNYVLTGWETGEE